MELDRVEKIGSEMLKGYPVTSRSGEMLHLVAPIKETSESEEDSDIDEDVVRRTFLRTLQRL